MRENNMKRLVLTGATGPIGQAIIRECIRNDIEVLVLCRKDSTRRAEIINHPLVHVVICALDEMKDFDVSSLKDKGEGKGVYDTFIHLAWMAPFGASRNDMYLQNKNVEYALDAVALANRLGCHTFIGVGSQAEYGRVNDPLRSDTSAFPENGYGMAKLCAGQMTREYAHSLGMRHEWVRVLSVYGPGDRDYTLISTVIQKLKQGISPDCTLGEQMWDYVYCDDVARAFLAIAEHGVDGKVYPLGSGEARPLREFIEEIREAVNPEVKVNYGAIPYSNRQVMYLQADISELEKDTGWRPETTFKEGIEMILKGENTFGGA